MSPLFGPILAQLVTLAVSDRTEARYIATNAGGSHAEAATAPRVGLDFGWKHTELSQSTLSLGYGPTFTATPILETKTPELFVFQAASLGASHSERWERTTFTIGEQLSYTLTNPRLAALSGGGAFPQTFTMAGSQTGMPSGNSTGTPTGNPSGVPNGTGNAMAGTGTAGNLTPAQTDRNVQLFTETTTARVEQFISARLKLGGELGYLMTGAVRESDRSSYPLVRGPRGQLFAAYRATRHDTLTSSVSSQYASLSMGNTAWVNVANEAWSHQFDARTSSTLAGGVSASRSSQPDGLVAWSIYPVFNANIGHVSRLGRGSLALGLSASSAPALDPIQGSVDPRLTLGALAALGQDRFSMALTVASAVALTTTDGQSAFNSINSSLSAGYQLGAGFSVDSGVRALWQKFGGDTTIPASLVAFVGVTFGDSFALNH